MNAATKSHPFTVALIGNPNTGKSTLFSALVGVHQQIGNYPGVTVEKKTGELRLSGRRIEVIDLPGLYSLAPRSRDEFVVADLLLGRRCDSARVDAVVCVVDAGNLHRNLYLVSQVLELGLPVVVAVNMLDVAEDRGVHIDLARLEQRLGVPVTPLQANRRIGLPRLKTIIAALADAPREGSPCPQEKPAEACPKASIACRCCSAGSCSAPVSPGESRVCGIGETPLPEAFETEVIRLESDLASCVKKDSHGPLPRCLVRRLLLDADGYLQGALLDDGDCQARQWIEAARRRLADAGCATPGVETQARYGWVEKVLDGVLTEPGHYKITATDRIDRVLTHRLWGTLIFAVVMLAVFQAVFVWAQPVMEWIQAATAATGGWITSHMAEGVVRSLLADGVIGGVGAVLVFLPQILILFAFLAVLEDCGYMARTAYLMDRLMVRVGLSGKSFIPLLSCFACTVPGIMATRVIEDRRDRLTTILVAPLLTCAARLPVYAMLIAAFIPARSYLGGLLGLQGLTLAALYLLGILAAVGFAMLLKRTLLRGRTPPFLMELPSYKWPSPRTVFFRVAERGWLFLQCAGTLILAVSILVWAALYFPHDPHATHQEQQRNSYLGRAGQLIEPAVKPLGWDWRIGCAVVASLPARELVVATLGVMYHVEDDSDNRTWAKALRQATWDESGQPVYNIPVALSIMVFFALCAQCAGTLAVIRRETNSWRWPAFTFVYMTASAYVAALATYQLGMWIGAG